MRNIWGVAYTQVSSIARGMPSGAAWASDGLPRAGNPIRILIVEQQQLVADALEALLSMQPGMVVVGNLGSIADSPSMVREMNPDVLIVEYRSEDGMSPNAAMAISQASSEAKVIFLTSDE